MTAECAEGLSPHRRVAAGLKPSFPPLGGFSTAAEGWTMRLDACDLDTVVVNAPARDIRAPFLNDWGSARLLPRGGDWRGPSIHSHDFQLTLKQEDQSHGRRSHYIDRNYGYARRDRWLAEQRGDPGRPWGRQ